MTLTGQYQYPDNRPGDVDAFSREPFVVRFTAPKTGRFSDTQDSHNEKQIFMYIKPFPYTPQPQSIYSAIKEFVLIPQHTTPTNTTKELDALYDVLQEVKKMWKTEVKV